MGKLNIAHHKSYHPYRRDNIERVRKDEEEARLKEQNEEGRMMLADAEARMDVLRQRADVSGPSNKKGKRRDEDDMKLIASTSSMQAAVLPTTNGHINLFEDLEHTQKAIAAAIRATRSSTAVEQDKGFALAPAPKDLKPWYSERKIDKEPADQDEDESEKWRKEENRKAVHDPLTSITKQLATDVGRSSSAANGHPHPRRARGDVADRPPEVQSRLSRESSERQRALELIRRKKRELEGGATPRTSEGGYGDVYNRQEVEEAHRWRDRRGYGNRRW